MTPVQATRSPGRSRRRTGRAVRQRRELHRRALGLLTGSGTPFLLGGGYALRHYTGRVRGTSDMDVFVRRRDLPALMDALGAAGLDTDVPFPHWLGKARLDGECIDIIFSSGNGVAEVDDGWFAHAVPATVLEMDVVLSPPEEMIWSKAFVMERERYDGADISHLLRACHAWLDWERLLDRFGRHWRVLLSHLTLFGFIYPGERGSVPSAVMVELCRRLEQESREPAPDGHVCQGTLLSREQYLADVTDWSYADGRLRPYGPMTPEEVARWTAAIPGRR